MQSQSFTQTSIQTPTSLNARTRNVKMTPTQALAALDCLIKDKGQPIELPGEGRLFERGLFKEIKKRARRDMRLTLNADFLARRSQTNVGATTMSSHSLVTASNHVSSPSSSITPPLITIPLTPPDWEKQHKQLVRTASQYESFPIDPQSFEYRKIVELAEPYRVNSINKIVNRKVWDDYATKRRQMLRQKSEDPDVWLTLDMTGIEVDGRTTRDKEFRDRNPCLSNAKGKYDLNEALLFHCTRNKNCVEPILKQGLDERLGADATNVLMGKGIYFADHLKKSCVYVGDSRTAMLFTVILGDCKDMENGGEDVKKLTTEPEKQSKEMRNEDDRTFDSITGRPNYPPYNEFVIFNRNQCCPMYEIKLSQRSIESPVVETAPGHEHFEAARANSPDFVWKKQDQLPYYLPNTNGQIGMKQWPFFISNLFTKMDLTKNIESLKGMEYQDDDVNAYVLSELDNDLDAAVQFFQDVIKDVEQMTQEEVDANQPVAKKSRKSVRSNSTPASSSSETASPFSTLNMRKAIICRGCKEKYGYRRYVDLKCDHQVCSVCFPKLRMFGNTMKYKTSYSWIKCPICYEVDGVEIGTCPKGVMVVKKIHGLHCEGYENVPTHRILYTVWHDGEKDERTAYLPDTPKGRKLLKLLKLAWDRKLILSIGESISRGLTNVPIWNIEHKTNLTGGEENFGFPDETYLDRVLNYLKIYHLY